jgi:ABC-2 type transport system ATP-binding protein
MLEVVDVTRTYHGIVGVRGLSFTVRPGRVLGLLGPNGSGKSTTVRMLVGLLRPSVGTIRWNHVDVHTNLRDYQRLIGYVPEEPKLYAYLTATEYLELVGGLHDIAPRVLESRIDAYLELFDLDGDRHLQLSAFSKGMRQKVLMAAALVNDPQLVVFDEPCSGLDVPSLLIHRRMVAELAARGKIIVYSSHEMDLVEKVCDDVVILRKGQVVANDSVERLRQQSRSATLEGVFTALAVDHDVDRVGAALAHVAVETTAAP